MRRRTLLGAGAAGTAFLATGLPARAKGRDPLLAPSPPMGWNSWNSFATTINEVQALETAAIMRAKLLPSGYDIFTIDIQWYEPDAKSYTYNAKPRPVIDRYCRLLPAPNRFPSAEGGKGFAPIAAKIHAMGMRFGIHLMRGIPRLAVERNLAVLGTRYRAQDIADPTSICPWNPDMYGVDMRKPGAQAYYDSVFALYAGWGVDFVKMDDMSRPYDAHAAEIEAAHRAIAKTGRPILLSLSPGETPVARASHVRRFAQMWRISDDFWDEWPALQAQFTRLENWHGHAGPGGWPDADMLPLGRLALGERDTRFTPDEQRSLMTLWSIARAPLIMGGDLRHLDQPTLALLTNPDVLAVNQHSRDNAPHFLEDGVRCWTAKARGTDKNYLALFNLTDKPRKIDLRLDQVGLAAGQEVRDLWSGESRGPTGDVLGVTLRPHGAELLGMIRAAR